jgi:hypothetical protein
MDKWDYIEMISDMPDHGQKIEAMLNACGAKELIDITEEQAKTFYERFAGKEKTYEVIH